MLVYLSSVEHVVRIKVSPPGVEAFGHVESRMIRNETKFSKISMVLLVFLDILNELIYTCNADLTFSTEKRLRDKLTQSKLSRDKVGLIS